MRSDVESLNEYTEESVEEVSEEILNTESENVETVLIEDETNVEEEVNDEAIDEFQMEEDPVDETKVEATLESEQESETTTPIAENDIVGKQIEIVSSKRYVALRSNPSDDYKTLTLLVPGAKGTVKDVLEDFYKISVIFPKESRIGYVRKVNVKEA